MLDRVGTYGGSASQITSTNPVEVRSEGELPKVETTEEERPLSEVEKEKVAKVVDGLNDFLTPSHTSLKFEFHDKLNEFYVTLVDDTTKEIVKEIPSKKMLDFYAAMRENIGILVDKKI